MSEEGGSSFPSDIGKSQIESGKEVVGQKPHCLFISGGQGTYAGIRGIKEGLEQSYGVGRVEAFNSIFSKDPQNPQRFEQMADYIQEHAKEGLDIVAHSLGAAELRRAIKKITEKDPTFFDRKENTENLNIILMAPSGFSKNVLSAFNYLRKTLRYVKEQVDLGKISKSNTLFRGIDALTAFPPQGISSSDLVLALREAMPELSQYREGFTSTPVVAIEESFERHLSNAQKEDIAIYGEIIRNAIENKNYPGLALLVRAYGEKLRKPLAEIYAGSFESASINIFGKARGFIGGYIGLLSMLRDTFGSRSMKEITGLNKKGVNVGFVVPEYDIFMPLDEAIAFFEGEDEALKHIEVVEGVAHAFPALRPMGFGKIVSSL